MLKKVIKILSLAILFPPAFVIAESGGSIVGDGGYAVLCRSGLQSPLLPEVRRVELLDLTEAQIEKKQEGQTNLGPETSSAAILFEVASERLRVRLNLSEPELEKVAFAGREFLRLQSDPWSGFDRVMNEEVLKVRDIQLSQTVERMLRRRGCSISPIVVRPNLHSSRSESSRKACALMRAQSDFCFFTDRRLFRELSNSHKACLALHESLRYLPPQLRPSDDQRLRTAVAEICL